MSHDLVHPSEMAPSTLSSTQVEPGQLIAVSERMAQLLAGNGRHALFSEDGSHFIGTREHWTVPPVTLDDRHDLECQLHSLEQLLYPVERGLLLARVMTLLAHYRQEAMPPEVERAVAADWLEDLGEFPRWAVEHACRSWRRDPKRYRFRPLPGDLRQLCLGVVAPAQEWRRRTQILLSRLGPSVPLTTPEGRAAELQRRVAALAAAKRPH